MGPLMILCGLSIMISPIVMEHSPKCSFEADIVLVIPDSPMTEEKIFEDALINLIYYFDIHPRYIHIGLVVYGEESQAILDPSDFKTRVQVNTRITMTRRRRGYFRGSPVYGNKNLLGAFDVLEDMFKRTPDGVQKIAVFFTEGMLNTTMNEGKDIIDAAIRLNQSGIVQYNIGIGVRNSGSVFQTIGKDFCRLFSLGGTNLEDGLTSVVPYVASRVCAELDPQFTVESGNCDPVEPGSYFKFGPDNFTCGWHRWGPHVDPYNCAYYYNCGLQNRAPREQVPNGTLFSTAIGVPVSYNIFVSCF